MSDVLLTVVSRLLIAGRVYDHVSQYLPVWSWAETQRPERHYACQRVNRSAIRSGFFNNHIACHGRVQTTKIVVTARRAECMAELLTVVQYARA